MDDTIGLRGAGDGLLLVLGEILDVDAAIRRVLFDRVRGPFSGQGDVELLYLDISFVVSREEKMCEGFSWLHCAGLWYGTL
jgi:hypothetical protein